MTVLNFLSLIFNSEGLSVFRTSFVKLTFAATASPICSKEGIAQSLYYTLSKE